ncbi:plasma kallikrein-like [Phymastichus coffea]|uniref:plasma kallikrein-like n=1 Tax=Phymastichus coffea TaxID=108790 RepID=UPI00273C4FD0|nr:plasma kallikrein-like [Phymastichus coffea]
MRWTYGLGQGIHFCGGSIVSRQHIITAAHCVDKKRSPEIMRNIKVFAGTSRSDVGGKAYGISSITLHPGYTGASNFYLNDIAIVTLSQPMQFNANQQPIILPTKDVESGTAATITGWGDTRHPNGQTPIHLQKATMKLLDSSQCQSQLPYPLSNTQVCAVARPGLGVCSGDSGGPLAANGQLVGVASYVVECGKGHPEVYTNVYSFVDFIQRLKRDNKRKEAGCQGNAALSLRYTFHRKIAKTMVDKNNVETSLAFTIFLKVCMQLVAITYGITTQQIKNRESTMRGENEWIKQYLLAGSCASIEGRIIGGENANIEEYPYQISMRWTYGLPRPMHFCGGSIVSNKHIVTAAHCVYDKQAANMLRNMKIYAGTSRSDSLAEGKAYSVQSISVHPGYRGVSNSYLNDIAIVTLKEPIEFSAIQKPIELPSRDVQNGATAVVTGWGYTKHPNGGTPINLKKATMRLLPSSQCQRRLPYALSNSQVCAVSQPGAGVCSGDSGGPLAVNNQLVGIASYVVECGKGHPDVYTNVYSFVNFIRQTIGS